MACHYTRNDSADNLFRSFVKLVVPFIKGHFLRSMCIIIIMYHYRVFRGQSSKLKQYDIMVIGAIPSNLLMQSPLLSSHLYLKVTFSWPVRDNFIWIGPLLRCHLSDMATFSLSQRWPLNTGLTVYFFNDH